MDIPLGDYHLSSDGLNFVISNPPVINKKGEKRYPKPKYYANPTKALEGLLMTRLMQSDATTLRELLNEFAAYRLELSEVFDVNFGGK